MYITYLHDFTMLFLNKLCLLSIFLIECASLGAIYIVFLERELS